MKKSEIGESLGVLRTRVDREIEDDSATISGIEFIPVDRNRRYLHATIIGPADSPYEGGKFFLHIDLHN